MKIKIERIDSSTWYQTREIIFTENDLKELNETIKKDYTNPIEVTMEEVLATVNLQDFERAEYRLKKNISDFDFIFPLVQVISDWVDDLLFESEIKDSWEDEFYNDANYNVEVIER